MWFDNGTMEYEMNHRNGDFHGSFSSWYRDGQQKVVEHYDDGKLDGLQTRWYPNGIKSEETHYKNGKKEGAKKHITKMERRKAVQHFGIKAAEKSLNRPGRMESWSRK
jgi:antitoxin component YwqK of YwqJK toxin-antitoxin module